MGSMKVAVLDYCRTPIGKFLGGLAPFSAVELGTHVVKGLLDRHKNLNLPIGEVILGQGRQAGCGPNPARQVALFSGLPDEVPAFTVNRACGSGMEAMALAALKIEAKIYSSALVGGMESMSNVPFMLEGLRKGHKMGSLPLSDGNYLDGFFCRVANLLMGQTAEILGEELGLTREDQDRFAQHSQEKTKKALEEGFFSGEILPLENRSKGGGWLEFDEHPRGDSTLESLGQLKGVFSKGGSVTAGNSSGINDGATALWLADYSSLPENEGLKPLGFIRDYQVSGVSPKKMGRGPVPAIKQLLQKNGMAIQDIDLFEINEAFSAQVLTCLLELDLPPEKVNQKGGAIALGHPIGMSGGRVAGTLLRQLKILDLEWGVASLCVSGGQGVAMLLQNN